MSQLAYAYALAAISTLCWGVVVVPIKLTRLSGKLGIGISMLTGALATSLVAGRELGAFAVLPWTEMARFAVTGTFQFTLGCMLYYESIRRGSMSIAVPVTRVKVILVLAFTLALGLETFTWWLLGACVLVVLGGILLGLQTNCAPEGESRDGHRMSLLLAMGACVCWGAGETLIGTLPDSINAVAKNALLLWCGLVVYVGYALASGTWRRFAGVQRRDILCYVTHGLVSFSVAYVLMVRAIEIAGPPRISCITSTYPMISAMIGWVFFRERFSAAAVAGACLLVAGVIVLQFG